MIIEKNVNRILADQVWLEHDSDEDGDSELESNEGKGVVSRQDGHEREIENNIYSEDELSLEEHSHEKRRKLTSLISREFLRERGT